VITVMRPETTAALDDVRALMRAFVAWHRERHVEDLALIDEYFDKKEFEDELASLPGEYSPPDGQLLLACDDDKPAGCVALRRLDRRPADAWESLPLSLHSQPAVSLGPCFALHHGASVAQLLVRPK
jgi:hypothetical protein